MYWLLVVWGWWSIERSWCCSSRTLASVFSGASPSIVALADERSLVFSCRCTWRMGDGFVDRDEGEWWSMFEVFGIVVFRCCNRSCRRTRRSCSWRRRRSRRRFSRWSSSRAKNCRLKRKDIHSFVPSVEVRRITDMKSLSFVERILEYASMTIGLRIVSTCWYSRPLSLRYVRTILKTREPCNEPNPFDQSSLLSELASSLPTDFFVASAESVVSFLSVVCLETVGSSIDSRFFLISSTSESSSALVSLSVEVRWLEASDLFCTSKIFRHSSLYFSWYSIWL